MFWNLLIGMSVAVAIMSMGLSAYERPLVGAEAPSFVATAVVDGKILENFSLEQYRGKKNVVLFFYPLDFTFVCPTEFFAFQKAMARFSERDTELVACSVDSAYAHLAYLSLPQQQGGILGIEYPIIADLNQKVSRAFRVLDPRTGIAYRGLFLIDKAGVIRHIVVNDVAFGRSVPEVLRMVDALRFHESVGEVCPADWQAGEPGLVPSTEGLLEYWFES